VFLPVAFGSRSLGNGIGQALEEVLKLLVLVNGALARVIATSAAWQLRIRSKLERGRADEGIVLPRLCGIVERGSADVITEQLSELLLGDVEVGSGGPGGFGCTAIPLTSAEPQTRRTYSFEILPLR
jgi:hypothetical protein